MPCGRTFLADQPFYQVRGEEIAVEEQEILRRYLQGDAGGLAELVLAHENSLFRFCFYLCGEADAAEELFQDTWLRALKNIGKYKARGAFLGWLFTIAANLHRDKYRSYKRRQEIMKSLPVPAGAEADWLNCQEAALVRQAVESLDNSLRLPVILYYFEDQSVETIAKVLGLPEGTVKTRLYRARKRLKKELEVLLDG